MAVWLRIKHFLIEIALELLVLWLLKTGIQAVPFAQAVFLSFSGESMPSMLAILEFILVRLVIFLLVCAGSDWYKESSVFVHIRLGKRKTRYFSWINAFFCSFTFHAILVLFCGMNWIGAAFLECLVLGGLIGLLQPLNGRYYPFLFIIYLWACPFIS